MLCSAVRGEFPLKLFYHRSADKPGGIQGPTEDVQQFVLQFLMRCNEIQERYFYIRQLLAPAVRAFTIFLNTRAGFPATIEFAGTFRVTTLPAPTIAFSPTVTLARMVAPDPIEAPRLIRVGSTF